ncbi:MAG: hypothetical protein BIFFINMI_00401 [Phycisphaerae bacterium]|nr:hypothetical protein [Phycisphaerae bacterium]
MSQRHIHYEAAFEDYLRSVGRPYIAVDDAKKAVFGGAQIKSFDFLVYGDGPTNWLVDVKGRKLSLPSASSRGHLENWTTREDIVGLSQWARVFGDSFAGLLVFVYWLTEPELGLPFAGLRHEFRGRTYVMGATTVAWYASQLRDRSRRWGTVSVPSKVFRGELKSVDRFF